MWEARRDMDHLDKVAMRQSIDQMMRSSDVLRAQAIKLEKLRKSPYFGRFDFRARPAERDRTYYIGIHDFREEDTRSRGSMTGARRSRRCSTTTKPARRNTRRRRAPSPAT